MVWGQIAAAVAPTVVNKVLGGGKGTSWKSKWASFENDQEMQQIAFANKMKLAKKHKIHPLTMLGSQLPQISSPVYQGGSNTGQQIGEAISRGASAYFSGKATEKMNDLALERARLENELLRSQITSVNNPARTAGTAYSNDQAVLNVPDENIRRKADETGLTAGSENPPPAGKRFTVGNTPYGEVYITLPASGQADEYGEVYGAIKGLEYLAKRGYVHYARGTYKAGKKLGALLRRNKKTKPYSTPTNKGYSKITW